MYVEKLELYGFKSFPNRTEIPFARGITAIVGPNGCGKSNVSDAFRWVIGESNVRNLRGERVQDVIFKGTRAVKPMGMAEVTLTMRNDEGRLPVEYTQVGVARRIFRSGDTQYTINKNACRLRDIRELFSGTGLGSHGYSVIERSMIDQVLSDKDEARRFLFEEAAGIVLYKQRRKDASRKLQAVEGDLVRIEDMIREIEREVRSLARQAGKVRRWRVFRDELDRLEVRHALERWRALTEETEAVAAIRKQNEEQKQELDATIAVLEAKHGESRQIFVQLGDQLTERQRDLNEASQAVSSAHEEMQVLATRNESWTREEADLRQRLERDRVRLHEVREERIELRPRHVEMEKRLTSSRRRFEEALGLQREAENDLRQHREQLEEVQQMNLDLKSSHSETRKELEGRESRRVENERRLAALAGHLEAFVLRREKSGAELGELETESESLDTRLEELRTERSRLEGARAEAEETGESWEDRRNGLERDRAGVASRLAVLEEQHERHEGFDATVRWMLENREDLPGFVGVVGEEVRLRGDGQDLGRALLGDRVSWVLVEDEAQAIAIIGRLREEQLGGVTFFPLAEAGEDEDGDADVEALFDASDAAAPFVRYLSATSQVSGDAEAARMDRKGRRVASPEGLLFEADGAIHLSGTRTREAAILSREQEIPALTERLVKLDEELTSLSQQQEELEASLRTLVSEYETVSAEMQTAQSRRSEVGERSSSLRTELKMLDEEQARLDQEQSDLSVELSRVAEEITSLTAAVAQSGEDSTEVQERFNILRGKVAELETEKDLKVREATEREMEALRLENDLRELQSLEERLEKEEGEKGESVSEIERLIEERTKEASAADSRIEELRSSLEELQGRRREIEDQVRGTRDEHAESQVLIADLEDQLKSERSRLHEIVQGLHQDEMARVEARAEADQIRKRVQEEHRVDLAAWTKEDGFPEPEPETVSDADLDDDDDEDADDDATDTTTTHRTPADGAEPKESENAAAVVASAETATAPSGDGEEGDAPRIDPDTGEPIASKRVAAKPRPVVQLTDEDAALGEEERVLRMDFLRKKIAGMGMLNYLAEEEYETQKERLDFFSKQARDLHDSRNNLLETIRQINVTAGEMFQQTFDEVQRLFIDVFQELFPGGEASLRLVGDDPLESDVEISARPKGKRLESVRLLSTGERSLTAIALLFSLYMFKPSPVCLLDEVDAPLDDANLDRFLTMLSHMAKKTQFIMITHNKKTMKVAENLFGVTMEEPGVSKIVSVRLNENDLDLATDAPPAGRSAVDEPTDHA